MLSLRSKGRNSVGRDKREKCCTHTVQETLTKVDTLGVIVLNWENNQKKLLEHDPGLPLTHH